jgi:thymidylate synthase
MKQYIDLVNRILARGEERKDRTGVGTLSVFGGRMEFDLRDSFPLVTIKKTLWKSSFIEMLWFIRGEDNLSYLHEHNVHIWDDWADEAGNLGPIYGVQWRRWPGKLVSTKSINEIPAGASCFASVGMNQIYTYQEEVDQLKQLIEMIKCSPTGRRHIVTAWNPGYLKEMGLPPCHRDFQCYVSNDGHLDLMWSQRSWDVALGGPFNIAQYALLTHLIARATGLKPRYLSVNYGDAHLYINHVDQMRDVVINRHPLPCKPKLVIKTDNTNIDGYKIDNFDIEGYESHPHVKLSIAV